MNVEQRRIQCWDVDAGYAAAQEKYRTGHLKAFGGLLRDGFAEVYVFHNNHASFLKQQLDIDTYVTAAEVNDNYDLHDIFYFVFKRLATWLRKYFQSEFAPAFCSMLKMGPLAEAEIDDSYRWHVDNGPSCHLKLIIFLNDDHDGGTAVMSREDSRKFIDAGYLEQERLFHLDDFAADHGISYTPYKVQPKAGSGLIFEPTNVLHKGVYPTFGERRVFQIGIIPWDKPWDFFYDEHWAKGYSNSNGFPRYDLGDRRLNG